MHMSAFDPNRPFLPIFRHPRETLLFVNSVARQELPCVLARWQPATIGKMDAVYFAGF